MIAATRGDEQQEYPGRDGDIQIVRSGMCPAHMGCCDVTIAAMPAQAIRVRSEKKTAANVESTTEARRGSRVAATGLGQHDAKGMQRSDAGAQTDTRRATGVGQRPRTHQQGAGARQLR